MAKDLIQDSRAPGTRKNYSSAWLAWVDWCLGQHLDPLSTSSIQVVNFLSKLFQQGRSYRTINLHRSEISAGHPLIQGLAIGKEPLVCRLLRSIRLKNSPGSRYSILWDVNIILHFLKDWPDNKDIALKQLSAKLAILLCLISFRRVSDVRDFNVNNRSFSLEGVCFYVSRCTKTSSSLILYPPCIQEPKLCVVNCLRTSENATAS